MPVLIARVESTSLQPDSTRGDDQGPVVNPRNFSCRQWRGRLFSWAALFFLRTTRKPDWSRASRQPACATPAAPVSYRRLSNESSNAKNIAKMVAKLLGRLLNEDHRCNSASTCAHHDRSGCKARNLLAHQSTHRTAIPSLLIASESPNGSRRSYC